MKYYRSALEDYFSHSAPAFAVPEISKGFIPQGIAYDPGTECFFLSGYMDNGKNSPLFAIDGKTGECRKKVLMLTEAGEKFRGHAGGISVYGDKLYVAGSTAACMYSLRIDDVLSAENGASLSASQRIGLKTEEDFIRVSFTGVDEDYIYAGEFHKDPIFYTHKSHLVMTGNGKQKAYLFGFRVDEAGEAVPACVFSVPDNLQGACFADGYLYLSQSNGFLTGRILSYALDGLEPAGTKTVLGQEIPLYILTEDTAQKTTTVPPMPEEIIVTDGQMYILYEAASNRYLIGKALQLDHVYASPVSYFQ